MPTRRVPLLATPAVLLALTQGCAGAPEEAPDARVQAIFPTSAHRLLAVEASTESAVMKAAEGFAIRGPEVQVARAGGSSRVSIEAALPRRGDGVLLLRLPGF